jgi:hypothetical protein
MVSRKLLSRFFRKPVLQTYFGRVRFLGTRPNCCDGTALELEPCSHLHLEHLTARINIIDQDRACSWITNLQKSRIDWGPTAAAELTWDGAELAATPESGGGGRRCRSSHLNVGPVEKVEEFRRENQSPVFIKIEALLHASISLPNAAIPELVPLLRQTRNLKRPFIIYGVPV